MKNHTGKDQLAGALISPCSRYYKEISETTESSLSDLIAEVKERSGLMLKKDIEAVSQSLSSLPEGWHPNGDDTAAIPLGSNGEHGWQLIAIEGMQGRFVNEQPWFAGWCAVMVNCSDIAAMGGTPVAVVDAVWSEGDTPELAQLIQGMKDASAHLGVPIVGGHTNTRSPDSNLAVSILGNARALLSAFSAKPGQRIVLAIDHRGEFQDESLNWNAATHSPPGRMKDDLALLPKIAESKFASSCKDISQAGILGTLTMLLESSGCGALVDLKAIPKPDGVSMCDWLSAFPSFGYVFTCEEKNVPALCALFSQRDIHAHEIGVITSTKEFWVKHGVDQALFYDLSSHSLTGF